MKSLLYIFMLLFVSPIALAGGVIVDNDGDGLTCMLEDDGIKCGEDDQDVCDFIPNIDRNDDHCSVDRNGDGQFTIADVKLMLAQNDHTILINTFGGYACYDILRVIEYNARLASAGLRSLQVPGSFMTVQAGWHCYGHHTYPPIP